MVKDNHWMDSRSGFPVRSVPTECRLRSHSAKSPVSENVWVIGKGVNEELRVVTTHHFGQAYLRKFGKGCPRGLKPSPKGGSC